MTRTRVGKWHLSEHIFRLCLKLPHVQQTTHRHGTDQRRQHWKCSRGNWSAQNDPYSYGWYRTKEKGKKIPSTSWRRDPLGPPFHTNFIWGQRFIQLSLAVPDGQGPCQSRAIPIGFHHCPTPKKLHKNATEEQTQLYKEVKKQSKLSLQGSLHIKALREKLDRNGQENRVLCVGVDGSYTNSTVLKNLPERTILIGRTWKDTKLHEMPNPQQEGKGRKKVYGKPIPTPEQIRQSPNYEWQQVEAWAAGKKHQLDIKVV